MSKIRSSFSVIQPLKGRGSFDKLKKVFGNSKSVKEHKALVEACELHIHYFKN